MELLQAIEQRLVGKGAQMMAGQDAWAGIAVRVGEKRFLVPQDQVREVVELPGYSRVPGAKPWLMGVANIRGELVPIANINSLLFDGATSLGLNTRIVVLKHEKALVGILVDRVEGLRRFDAGQKQATDGSGFPDSCQGFLVAAYGDGESALPVFDLFKLVDDAIFQMAA